MTEAEFGSSFEKYIQSNPLNYFSYDMIYKEVESFQGIPDYLGIIKKIIKNDVIRKSNK